MDKSTVNDIANLARIKVSKEEAEELAGELSDILIWIDELNEVSTETIRPMTSVIKMVMPSRADSVNEGKDAHRVLKNAPEQAIGKKKYFTVPKVIE